MPLIELVCKNCRLIREELVKADGEYPVCPACGHKREQKYSGAKIARSKSRGCSGSCPSCRRCRR